MSEKAPFEELPIDKNLVLLEEQVKGWYQFALEILRTYNFEPSMADAAYLRRMVKDVITSNNALSQKGKSMNATVPGSEAVARFLHGMYGIPPWEMDSNSPEEQDRLLRQKFEEATYLRSKKELL